MTDLGTLGGLASHAHAINNSGHITGFSTTILGSYTGEHAFFYSNGTMIDLGTLGGDTSTGFDINDAGHVVGVSALRNSSDKHAFLYSEGAMKDLGTLGGKNSEAYGINSLGQITGTSSLAETSDSRAFVYSGGIMYDMNLLFSSFLSDVISSGFVTLEAGRDINAAGQITGFGQYFTGTHYQRRAFIATIGPASVPETTDTLVLFGLSFGGIVALRRRFSTASL